MFDGARYPELEARFGAAFAQTGAPAKLGAAAAWSLVHGLAQLMLDGHFAEAQRECGGAELFVKRVLGALRFAVGAQRSA
jgi:hypothetical protein